MKKFEETNGFDLGFVVGMIEGEGCINSSSHDGYPVVNIEICNTDRCLLEKCQEVLGGNIHTRKELTISRHPKKIYRLLTSGAYTKFTETILSLYPYLLSEKKKRQCLKALEMVNNRKANR